MEGHAPKIPASISIGPWQRPRTISRDTLRLFPAADAVPGQEIDLFAATMSMPLTRSLVTKGRNVARLQLCEERYVVLCVALFAFSLFRLFGVSSSSSSVELDCEGVAVGGRPPNISIR
jgi:hypothetical protein